MEDDVPVSIDGSDDLGWDVVDGVKGNLRKSNTPIIRVKIRNDDGTPAHKSEFRLDDRPSMVSFLNVLRDKFGVNCFQLKGEFNKLDLKQKEKEVSEEKKNLNEWREKTRGLREDDENLKEKMRESFA